jgi:hypothetical protein
LFITSSFDQYANLNPVSRRLTLTVCLAAFAVDLLRASRPMLSAGGGRRTCGISEGGATDDDRRAYLHVRLPRRRGRFACRNDQDHRASKSLKRGNVVSIRRRYSHLRDLTTHMFDVVEVVMFIPSNQIALPFSFELDLCAWANAVYEEAVGEGFIRVPWEPDDAIVRRLQAYFHSGLSPAEAASACFCLNH